MHKAELEFKRIQTFLFASPRLRAMLGANSALGKTVRMRLPKLAQECGAAADPALAERMPAAAPEDPLGELLAPRVSGEPALMVDHPQAVYRQYGVLVRDGGHFIATFPERANAERFILAAQELIAKELPGILLDARLDGEKVSFAAQSHCLYQHPAFQVCQALGNAPAAYRNPKQQLVSAIEHQMEQRAKAISGDTYDVIGLLLLFGFLPSAEWPPTSVTEIASDGYIALIHADGNGVGQRFRKWMDAHPKHDEARSEHFFHSMRVAVRRALLSAVQTVFSNAPERYQLLMLGGDDLLLVCSAEYALPFVHEYAKALCAHPLSDGQPLTVGAGVAIAKDSFPFYRLHETAEMLADSAKQLSRADPNVGSVVDWHVTTNAWVGDPIEERRAEALASGAILSRKPYPVLGPSGLEGMLRHAKNLALKRVARSQLRKIVEVMRAGPNQAELAWLELPANVREELESALANRGPFRQLAQGVVVSEVPDLVELFELLRYGKELV